MHDDKQHVYYRCWRDNPGASCTDRDRGAWRAWALVAGAALLWWIAWNSLLPLAAWLTFEVLGLTPGSALGEAVAFFLYDVPKILLLLTGMIFVVTTIRTFFSAERTRQLLGGKREGVGNVLAAGLGVVTPFCSCSAVPLFIGFIEAGVPLGVTFSFLIAAPMVNEVALAMLFGMFGYQIALLYMGTGLIIAILAGVAIGRVPHIESGVEDFVWQMKVGQTGAEPGRAHDLAGTLRHRLAEHARDRGEGVAVRCDRHRPRRLHPRLCAGRCPGRHHGRGAWWSVPAAVAIGVPMYANAAGVIPVVRGADREGCGAGHGAGLYDERGGVEPAGDDHPAPGAQAAAHRGLCHDCGRSASR